MTTCGFVQNGARAPRGSVRSFAPKCESAGELTGWPGSWIGLVSNSDPVLDKDSVSLFPSRDVATSSTPTASVVTQIPVWPPNRQIWTPPSIVCTRGCVGAEGVRFGKRDGPSVPRSRRESHLECHGARLRPRKTTACRRAASSGSRGWPPIVRRMPVCSGRHHRQRSSLRRFSVSASWEHRRRGA